MRPNFIKIIAPVVLGWLPARLSARGARRNTTGHVAHKGSAGRRHLSLPRTISARHLDRDERRRDRQRPGRHRLRQQHATDTARMVIAEIRKITTKPVRTLINSHWHQDHGPGNDEYVKAFPGLQMSRPPNHATT